MQKKERLFAVEFETPEAVDEFKATVERNGNNSTQPTAPTIPSFSFATQGSISDTQEVLT